MKTSLILILSAALFLGCKSGNKNAYSDSGEAEMGVSDNNLNNTTWDQDKIKEFVDEAATGSMMEVQLGQIAQKRALSQQVKDFGKTMEKTIAMQTTN